MQWTTREKRERKSIEDRSNIPLEVHIKTERIKLEEQNKKIPLLLKQKEDIEKKNTLFKSKTSDKRKGRT